MKAKNMWIHWVVFAGLVLIAYGFSFRHTGILEGYKGSYLGRSVADQQLSADRVRELVIRAAPQRE